MYAVGESARARTHTHFFAAVGCTFRYGRVRANVSSSAAAAATRTDDARASADAAPPRRRPMRRSIDSAPRDAAASTGPRVRLRRRRRPPREAAAAAAEACCAARGGPSGPWPVTHGRRRCELCRPLLAVSISVLQTSILQCRCRPADIFQ